MKYNIVFKCEKGDYRAMNNRRFFTSEAVSEGHPDKVADQISDAILDSFLAQDKDSRVAVETMVTTGQVIVAGEVTSEAYVDVPKVVRDTYGGYGAHGGGAFSGKDPSKVDRSAAYMARYIAKNMVATGFADRMLIQLAYAIGVAEPVSINVNTYGTAHDMTDERIEAFIRTQFDLTPEGIERELHLKAPIYGQTAAYGHFGRMPYEQRDAGDILQKFFPWEEVISRR